MRILTREQVEYRYHTIIVIWKPKKSKTLSKFCWSNQCMGRLWTPYVFQLSSVSPATMLLQRGRMKASLHYRLPERQVRSSEPCILVVCEGVLTSIGYWKERFLVHTVRPHAWHHMALRHITAYCCFMIWWYHNPPDNQLGELRSDKLSRSRKSRS